MLSRCSIVGLARTKVPCIPFSIPRQTTMYVAWVYEEIPAFISIFVDVRSPSHYGLLHEDIELVTSDRIVLRCYLLRPSLSRRTRKGEGSKSVTPESAMVCREFQSKRYTLTRGLKSSQGSVIMFHGNGMDYGDCISGAGHIIKMGYSVLILSYRG